MHDIRPFLHQLFNSPGTLLYVGARADAHSWLEELIEAGNEVSVLEVWYDNVASLSNTPLLEKLEAIELGDIREVNNVYASTFDYIFWWHGPEHLSHHEIIPTLQALEAKCNRLIALACPYGLYPQGAHAGNPYETHQTTLYPDFFEALGYEVRTDGEADKPGGEIVAWKAL